MIKKNLNFYIFQLTKYLVLCPWEDEKSNELSPYKPNSPYSASKAASDHLVRAWGETYKLPVITTNCTK